MAKRFSKRKNTLRKSSRRKNTLRRKTMRRKNTLRKNTLRRKTLRRKNIKKMKGGKDGSNCVIEGAPTSVYPHVHEIKYESAVPGQAGEGKATYYTLSIYINKDIDMRLRLRYSEIINTLEGYKQTDGDDHKLPAMEQPFFKHLSSLAKNMKNAVERKYYFGHSVKNCTDRANGINKAIGLLNRKLNQTFPDGYSGYTQKKDCLNRMGWVETRKTEYLRRVDSPGTAASRPTLVLTRPQNAVPSDRSKSQNLVSTGMVPVYADGKIIGYKPSLAL